jgi:hypothetical protein
MPEIVPRGAAAAALIVAGLVSTMAGCTIETGQPAQGGQPAVSAAPAASTPAASTAPTNPAKPSEAAAPPVDPAQCFIGTYAVVSIVGRQGIETVAGTAKPAGDGGSLVLELRANTWTLRGDGSKPVKFEVGPYQVDASINGTLRGSHRRVGNTFVFKQEDAEGTVTLSTPIGSKEYDMEDVGPALAPAGTATLTCGPDTLDFVSESVTMTLRRKAGA